MPASEEYLLNRIAGTLLGDLDTRSKIAASREYHLKEIEEVLDFLTFPRVGDVGVEGLYRIIWEEITRQTYNGPIGTFGPQMLQELYEYSVADQVIPVPNNFGWTPPITLYRKPSRAIDHNFNIEVEKPTGKTYYTNIATGSDSNNGLTAGTAYKSIFKSQQQTDADVISIAAGRYGRSFGFRDSVIPSRSIAYIATGGKVISSGSDDASIYSWTADGTFPNVYSTTRNSVLGVYDYTSLDSNGDMLRYSQQSSIATVNANAGSWWLNGSTLYIHTFDNRAPDINVLIFLNVGHAVFNPGTSLVAYFENIEFWGGTIPFRGAEVSSGNYGKLYFKDCAFKYGFSNNGLTITGALDTFLQNCVAAKNAADGFNYHTGSQSGIPRAIEINCVGRDNGLNGNNTNNGSTMHDAGKIIRINGEYMRNNGGNLVDSGSGTKSWHLGCYAHDSSATDPSLDENFVAISSAETWLDTCREDGSLISLEASSSGILNKFRTIPTAAVVATGTVRDYEG